MSVAPATFATRAACYESSTEYRVGDCVQQRHSQHVDDDEVGREQAGCLHHARADPGHPKQFGRDHGHPGLPDTGAYARQDAGRRGGEHDFAEPAEHAAMAERGRDFEQAAFDRSDRPVRRVEVDPEHRNRDDEGRARRVQPEPQDRERHPGEARDRPQQPHDPGRQRVEARQDGAGEAGCGPEQGAEHEAERVMRQAVEDRLLPVAAAHLRQPGGGQATRQRQHGRRHEPGHHRRLPHPKQHGEAKRAERQAARGPSHGWTRL